MKLLPRSLFLSAGILFSQSAYADNLVAVADEWRPYTQGETDPQKGFLTELVVEAMKISGHTVTYRSWPFQRCLEAMDAGIVDMIIGVYAADIEPKKYEFNKTAPLAVSTNAFFTLKNKTWNYKNPSSLGRMRVGLAFGYDWGELNEPASAKKIQVDWISDANPLEKSIQKLLLGRIDTLVDDTLAVETEAKRIGAWEKLRSAGQLGTPQNIYAAFANTPRNKNAKIYSKDLADGVTKLRKNGTYARILSKYKAAR